MMKNPLVHRLMEGELEGGKADFLHSSAYGKAQNRDGIGVASTESFQQRQAMERNRSTIRGYKDSLVAEQRSTAETFREKQQKQTQGDKTGVSDLGTRERFDSDRLVSARGGLKAEKPANLNQAAKVRAERSARFAPQTGGTGVGRPVPRRLPGVKK